MKNVHVLPTDRPSGLFKDIKGKLGFNTKWTEFPLGRKNQHINITSNEDVEVNDVVIDLETNDVFISKGKMLCNDFIKKIILTTDLYLIRNGVKSIDDVFLEWFVKNPSCDFVEVKKVEGRYVDYGGNVHNPISYKIIIPQEEPKQETPEEAAEKCRKKWLNDQSISINNIFSEGANWQAKRMYSEEEVLMIISSFKEYLTFGDEIDEKEWFEQHKKK